MSQQQQQKNQHRLSHSGIKMNIIHFIHTRTDEWVTYVSASQVINL